MIVYKLFKRRKNGTLGPLFINKRQIIPVGEWITAEDNPTNGYAHRPGWHVCREPKAPHLKMYENRVWYSCEIPDRIYPRSYNGRIPHNGYYLFPRPEHQGGVWVIAGKLKLLDVI